MSRCCRSTAQLQRLVTAACVSFACGPSPVEGSGTTETTASDVSSSSQPTSGDTTAAETSTATGLPTSSDTGETSASASSSTGLPAHCIPHDDYVELEVEFDALDADPNRITTSARETCAVTATTMSRVELDCPEAGPVEISYRGPDGLDLRQLPDEVLLDFSDSPGFLGPGGQLRFSLSTADASLLIAFAGAHDTIGFGVVDNPWLAPLWIGRRVLDCPPDNFGGTQCTLAELEVNAPRGSVTAVQAEQVNIPGGWRMVLSAALECDTSQGSERSPTRFGIVHESLLP